MALSILSQLEFFAFSGFNGQIFGTNQAIDKRKMVSSTTIPSTFNKKNGEPWSTNKRVYMVNAYSPKMNITHAV